MERLTDYSDDECTYIIGVGNKTCEEFCKNAVDGCKNCYIQQVFKKLADYEDLEEQGLLVRLPVAIGAKVYIISPFFDCIYNYDNCKATQKMKCVEDIPCEYEKRLYRVEEIEFYPTLKDVIGKTVFLTREEAEKKLEEMKNDKT